mgnify:CR=1 FL=1|tara:strand:+ start:94 stop:906 length:813 start_codon:yes stop_codon:yes gene_type:complete
MKTKSVVLKKFQQLLELKYTGRTPVNYTYHVRLFLNHTKNVPDRVTSDDVLNYQLSIRNKSHSFRNVAINAIKTYFKYYLRRRLKSYAVTRPRPEKKLPKHIPHDFLIEKISNIKNLKARLILSLGYGCGLRRDEVINIKLSDINRKDKYILIRGKGAKEREVPISPKLTALLIEYWKQYRSIEYLFNGISNNGCMTLQYSGSSILKLVKTHIGPQYNFHSLRHSYATRLLSQGVDISIVSKLLGHSNIKTTMIYNHLQTSSVTVSVLPL